MHKDMHYAGTYALAKLAGLSDDTALKIGVSAQFVDDSADDTAIMDEKAGELFVAEVSTRYADIAKYRSQKYFLRNHIDQLAVWVPFHFLPGGKGDTLTQKLVCQTDSKIARAMIASHLNKAVALGKNKREWGPYLIGVAAHVYADTFAHYGFSGVSSRRNLVKASSIRVLANGNRAADNGENNKNWRQKVAAFRKKYKYKYINIRDAIKGIAGELSTSTEKGAMGHGGVASMPDYPFLVFSFQYERKHLLYDGQPTKPRNNPATYLQACERMHRYFAKYLAKSGEGADVDTRRKFAEVKSQIAEILSLANDDEEKRLRHWQKKAKKYWGITIPNYPGKQWKKHFAGLTRKAEVLDSDAYKFFMAAAWHKKTVLDEILPKHGIHLEFRQYREDFAPDKE